MWAMSQPQVLPQPALHVQRLSVERGGRTLASGLDFTLPAGGVIEVKGPNGAGKTSLLLTLAGVLRPGAGVVQLRNNGETLPLAPQLHFLAVQNAIKPRLTVRESLDFWRSLAGATGVASEPALERVGLGGLGPIEAGHLSTGQQRRLAVARLLVSRRTLWLLDEPAAALDTDGEALVSALIAEHCEGGGIAVVATHHPLALPNARTIAFGAAGATLEAAP
jgi:heme exporter protein A